MFIIEDCHELLCEKGKIGTFYLLRQIGCNDKFTLNSAVITYFLISFFVLCLRVDFIKAVQYDLADWFVSSEVHSECSGMSVLNSALNRMKLPALLWRFSF